MLFIHRHEGNVSLFQPAVFSTVFTLRLFMVINYTEIYLLLLLCASLFICYMLVVMLFMCNKSLLVFPFSICLQIPVNQVMYLVTLYLMGIQLVYNIRSTKEREMLEK